MQNLQAKNERIEQLERDLEESDKVILACFSLLFSSKFFCLTCLLTQQLDKFRELYLIEQEEKMNVESELKDCKVLEKTH